MERTSWTYLRGEAYTRSAVVEALLAVAGVSDVLPAYDSTMVEYDAGLIAEERLAATAEAALSDEHTAEARVLSLRVLYGGEHGPDLAGVAARAGMSPAEAAALHAEPEYEVRAVGFAPGFPFMSGVPEPLRAPRLPAPRARVPAHSVGVAGHQTGVYPVATPGGWNLLGRALEAVYDPHRSDPFLLRVGDRVRFRLAVPGVLVEPPAGPSPLALLPAEPARPRLEVVEQGLHDLVVDGGRLRAGRFGLARGGAMDAPAARLANRLAGNHGGAPLLEMTLTGPRLLALSDVIVAVSGPALEPVLGGEVLPSHAGFRVRAGDELTFRPTGRGARSYLAVAGGIESGAFLGSASTDARGLLGRPLERGDVIGAGAPSRAVPGRRFEPHRGRAFDPYRGRELEPYLGRGVGEAMSTRAPGTRASASVRLLPGPQWNRDAWEALVDGTFEVVAADRVGIRLGGRPVPGGEVTSEGTPIGAVQVPPGGDPLVLMNDRGTLGGYAKPAVVHPADLAVLAQSREGTRLRFSEHVTRREE